jgi:hypothetical protein
MAIIATELIETKRDERGRRITPAAERETLVRAYEESGLTQKAFARQEGVKYTTFVSWGRSRRRHVLTLYCAARDQVSAARASESVKSQDLTSFAWPFVAVANLRPVEYLKKIGLTRYGSARHPFGLCGCHA